MSALHTVIMPWIIALLLGGYSCHTAERGDEGVELLPRAADVVVPIANPEPPTRFVLEIERKRKMALATNSIIKIITTASAPFAFFQAVNILPHNTELIPLAIELTPLVLIGTAGNIALEHLASKISTSTFVVNKITHWWGDDPITKDSIVESVYFAQTLVYSQFLGNIARVLPQTFIVKSLKCMGALHSYAAPATSLFASISQLMRSRPAAAP